MSAAAKNDVEAAAPAVTAVRAAYRGDARRMARDREPVVNGGANPAAFDRRIAAPTMSGDEEDDARATSNRAFEDMVDRAPCSIETHAMKIQGHIGLDVA